MTKFTVVNHANESVRVEDSRADAEDRKQLGITDLGIAEENIDVVQGAFEDYEEATNYATEPVEATDGGNTEIVESTASPEPTDGATPEVVGDDDSNALDQLGESLENDPLSILPGHMTDKIQGEQAVNKRGYAMIAERYGIETSAEIVELPWENDEGRCVAKATAITDDGKEYSGWATASADDGDMPEQLIELAETRALKRSVAWASGVGIVSYQELSNQLE